MYLNEKPCTAADFRQVVAAFSNPEIRQSRGGWLFRLAKVDDCLHMGIVPAIIEGQRSYHYNIKLKKQSSVVISGMINAVGALFMVPQRTDGKMDFCVEDFHCAAISMHAFVLALRQHGMSSEMPIDPVAAIVLMESTISSQLVTNLEELEKSLNDYLGKVGSEKEKV